MSENTIHAEISVIPIGIRSQTTISMSKEIAAAFDAIQKIKGLKTMLTPMGTQIESNNFANILKAIEVAHEVVRTAGAKRIMSTIRIDERLDKSISLEEKVESVMEKIGK
ncbi:MAG TPA: MTH1187 family thiamine-binding protein [Nitrososphaeraceae archaeon]|nr:MTH1187 family thiamine-binding protein [Nitrososphaeraceae archaeon]